MADKKKLFRQLLMDWDLQDNQRDLPWKGEKDPYRIWLSEIMLQQTRAEQGLAYYLKFIEAFPTVSDLALADDDLVFKMWQGLGYYNRCKNMLFTARYIHAECRGRFPDTYESIRQLKGVGNYTAAAIASFAYKLPYAVVDGNVYRILARYFGITGPSDSTEGKILFAGLAQDLLDKKQPAAYNQAIMDFGAVVCTPKNASCEECPLNKHCIAFREKTVYLLPVKTKKVQSRERFFDFLVLEYKDQVWIEKRNEKDVWQNLHQFFLMESEKPLSLPDLLDKLEQLPFANLIVDTVLEYETKQQLTHQKIYSRFLKLRLSAKPKELEDRGFWVSLDALSQYAFPKTLALYCAQQLQML